MFYLRLYDVGHMVKDHSDSERGNPLPPLHGLLFPIIIPTTSERVLFYMLRHDSTYHGFCYVEHWLERELAQRVHYEGSIRCPIALSTSSLALHVCDYILY